MKRPFSEIRLRRFEEAGSMETFRVIGRSLSSNAHLFKELKALEFLLLEFTEYFVVFVHNTTS